MVTTWDYYPQTLSHYYSTKSKYHDDSNKLVIGKMKDETAVAVIEESAGLRPKMHSYLVDDNKK